MTKKIELKSNQVGVKINVRVVKASMAKKSDLKLFFLERARALVI